MHCHTLFSVDAHGTPEDLVDAAVRRGVQVLSITEHNNLGSLQRAQARAAEQGLRYIAGVEIDALWQGRTLHVLAYGFDPEHPDLIRLLEANRALYTQHFKSYLDPLAKMGYQVDLQALEAGLAQRYPGHPSPALNVWYAAEVWVKAGLFESNEDVRRTVAQIRAELEPPPPAFAPLQKVQQVVKAAGGVLLLAHVARYFPKDLGQQLTLLQGLRYQGIDGFELHHPDNRAEAHFDQLAEEAEDWGCLVSGGSDCHDFNAPGDNALGGCVLPDAGPLLAALDQPPRQKSPTWTQRLKGLWKS